MAAPVLPSYSEANSLPQQSAEYADLQVVQWAGLSGQAAIVAAVLDHLIVNPGTRGLNRLDPARLTLVWRV